jgi:hypothetical protein
MSNETESLMLKAVLEQYATPDPKIVGMITKNGVNLDFVGHAEITRILIEIDPMWNWQPAAWIDGRPAIYESNGVATMWGNLTLLNKTLTGVGTANTVMTTRSGEKFNKPDYEKELIGDFLRNAAMRFGICLSLWSKQDREQPTSTPAPIQEAKQNHPASPMTIKQIEEVFTKPATVTSITGLVSDKQKGLISKLAKEKLNGDVAPVIQELFSKQNLNTLTTKEGSELIKHIMNLQTGAPEEPF